MRKLIIALLMHGLIMVSLSESVSAHREQEWINQIIAEESVRADVWYWKLHQTIHCESDHFDIRVIDGRRLGKAGEIGGVQLHPSGMLPVFYRLGFTNPRNLRQSVRFLAEMVAENPDYRLFWSCYPRGDK